MNPEESRFQALALADHVRRGGSAARWWSSKVFSGRDRRLILAALRRLRDGDRERRRGS